MSIVLLYQKKLVSDTQNLVNCGDNDEYVEIGQKIHVSDDNKFAFGVVGHSFSLDDLSVAMRIIGIRLSEHYLNTDKVALDFSEAEAALLVGDATRKIARTLIIVTQDRAWRVRWLRKEKVTEVLDIDPNNYWVIGSETNYSNVYYKAGLSPKEIVERVIRLANSCGGAAEELCLSKLKKFPRTVKKVK